MLLVNKFRQLVVKIIGCVAAAHRQLNRIGQLAPMCIPRNTYMLHWAHPSLKPKRHLDWFSRFAELITECRLACPSIPFPSKLPLPMG